jgi:hypothetical protein
MPYRSRPSLLKLVQAIVPIISFTLDQTGLKPKLPKICPVKVSPNPKEKNTFIRI